MTSASKILVLKLGALGDFIQALGPMSAIRKHHPGAHITLLTTKPFEIFARDCGYFDDVWIDERPSFLNIKAWLRLAEKFNDAEFTRVYDLQNNDRTRFYFRLFNALKRPEWVGTAHGASHRNTSAERTAGHAFDGHAQTLALAGIKNIAIDRLEWLDSPINSFPLRKPYVLLVPGSAPQRPEKRWPADKYGRLAVLLAQSGFQPVILGTQSESEAAGIICQICPEALDLTGQTKLGQISAMARGAAAAIGNDTGPMHLIAATSCPALVLFSRHSNPIKHAPKGENIKIVQKENLPDLNAEDVLKHFTPRQEPPRQSITTH